MNIVYLLGAGASYGCLPTIAAFQDKDQKKKFLNEHIEFLKTKTTPTDVGQNFGDEKYPVKAIMNSYYNDLEWLFNDVAASHSSIDTFVKRMFLIENRDFADLRIKRFKNILIAYFSALQITNPPDKRYDSFFASILEEKASNLPKGIKIISWNYDLQWEIAYSRFSLNQDVMDARRTLNVSSKGVLFPAKVNDSSFEIVNLNGSCLWNKYADKKRDVLNPFNNFSLNTNSPWDMNTFREIMIHYWDAIKTQDKVDNNLSFSWEPEDTTHSVFSQATNLIANTDVIVVIGYSFPTFNRKYDKQVLSRFGCDGTKGKKIYIQCSKDNDRIRDRLVTLLPREFGFMYRQNQEGKRVKSPFELVEDTSNFFIPPEFD